MSRLVLLHGFTQTGASWHRVAAGFDVTAPDLPGHGSRADVRADLWQAAELVADAEGPGVYVGYSMGGRIALHVALARPDVVRGLVLISATAGIDDAAERADRIARDEHLATRIETIGAEAFLGEWLAQPMFAGLPVEGRRDRSTDAEGLASSLRLSGTGTQEALWARLHEITVPVLVAAGERDAKYVALAERLVTGLPDAELVIVRGAGHAVHLESPGAFVEALRAWLARHDL